MFSSSDKTVKSAPAAHQKAAGNTFFRKAEEQSFFGAKESPGFFGKPVQPKLTVSTPDDPQEKEADAVADKVMRMPEPLAAPPAAEKKEEKLDRKEELQPKTEAPVADNIHCRQEPEQQLQAKACSCGAKDDHTHIHTKSDTRSNTEHASGGTSLYPSDVMRQSGRGPPAGSIPFEQTLASSKGGGSALPSDTRRFMESRIGADFSGVRIHTGTQAESMSRSVQAQAFAHGSDIYFNSGKYSPDTSIGKTLLAHELTHTVQQGAAGSQRPSAASVAAKALNRKAGRASFSKLPPLSAPAADNKNNTLHAEATGSFNKVLPKATLSNLSVDAKGTIHSSPVPPSGKAFAAPEQKQHKEDAQAPKDLLTDKQYSHELPPAHASGDTIAASIMRSSAAAIQLKHVSSPQADPAFVAETAKVKKTALEAKKHEPAAKKAKDAQSAAKPPANEKESKAKDKKVEEMAQQEPGTFDEARFKAALREKIAALQLNTLKEAEDFKANNRAASLKGDVSAQVNSEKDQAVGNIEGKVKEAPAPGSVQGKEVGPDPKAEKDVAVLTVNGAQAAPKPVPAEDVSLQKESQGLDQQMKDAKVTDKQLAKSNEPKFTGALENKKEAQQDAQQRPQDFRKDEKGIIGSTQLTAASTGRAGLAAMAATHKQKAGGALSKQQEAKAKDEADRAKIATDIEQKFNSVKTEVEGMLSKLDTDVTAMFDQGIAAATRSFEDYVDQEVRKFKIDRYLSQVGGAALWVIDLFTGTPAEINDIYARGKQRYIQAMDVVIDRVAKLVVSQLNAAKKRISQGKQEIKSYVESLPKDLQKIGAEAASNIQARFSELEQNVNNKQGELVDSLAAKYKAGLENVDKKIAEMKEANKGFIDKAKEAISEVIDAIIEFKNMLMNVLARAAAAIDLIIEDPIRFLGYLVAGVKQGVQKFASEIGKHLKDGLMGWLFGELGKAGIQMPQSFDAKGIMSLVLQVLGLTYANIRSRAVNIVGENVVKALETAAELFIVIKNEGIAGLWRFIQEKVEQLKDTVIESIKSFVIEKIVVAGVTWLISMLNPASAFIKACKMIYDVIMFFVTRGSQIMALVNAVINSVTAIAQGAIGVAASAVENALAKALPVAISFLASLLGLGGISEKIKSIIAKIQAPVNAAIDWVINKAVALVKAAGKLLGIGKDKDPEEEKKDKEERLEKGINAAEKAVNRFAGKPVGKVVLTPLLAGIKLMYRMQSLEVVQIGDYWGVEGVVNPKRTKKTEAHYQGIAQKLDEDTGGGTHGHGYSDHGAQTTASEQETRLNTGLTPGGRQPLKKDGTPRNPPSKASKFTQHESQVKASEIAKSILKTKNKDANGNYLPNVSVNFRFFNAGVSYSLDSSGNAVETKVNNVQAFFKLTDPATGTYGLITIYPE